MWDKWFLDKELSTDWTSMHFNEWDRVFTQLQIEGSVNVLEVGSWEGRSAIFFLNRLPLCTLTCIDTFEGTVENKADTWQSSQIPKIEERFNKNLEAFSSRYRKIKKPSAAGLSDLISRGEMFDVIFIDGSHQRDDVCVDSLLAIKLLKDKGLIIWDDYGGGDVNTPQQMLVKPAVDLTLSWHALQTISSGYQIIAQKT